MKVNQTTNICPRLKPVQLPLVGKCLSINSATRIFKKNATMTGISSVRSWVIVMCSLMPRAYLNSYFLAKLRTNCELNVIESNKSCLDKRIVIGVLDVVVEFVRVEVVTRRYQATPHEGHISGKLSL